MLILLNQTNEVMKIFHTDKIFIFIFILFLVGRLFVGYIEAGIDTILFLVLTSHFKIALYPVTATSIVTMGLTAMIPFGIYLFILSDVPASIQERAYTSPIWNTPN